MTTPEEMYRRWLLECVMLRGWSTVRCALEIGADKHQVKLDFEESLKQLPSVTRQ